MKFNLFDLLLPRETKFYTFLTQQSANLVECTVAFKAIVGDIHKTEPAELRRRLAAIKEFEKKGDAIERQIIDELDKTFITPLDREDIHHIATCIDRTLDMIDSLCRRFEMYDLHDVPAAVLKFCDIIVDSSRELNNLMIALPKKEGVTEIIRIIHELEKRGDETFHHSMAELLTDKNQPVFIIKFKEVYELLEDVIDSIDTVGKIVRGIMVKVG